MKRRTKQRASVYAALLGVNRPLSPKEILEEARRIQPGIGLATIYRALGAMVEEGVLAVVQIGGQPDRYELAGKGHHHHFFCRLCNRVYETKGCGGSIAKMAPRGFEVESHEVLLYGRCPSCLAGS